MAMKIFFDMDGTIADLYGDPDWLEKLIAGNEMVYANALPLLNLSLLARYIHKVQKMGYEVGIISWLAKNSTPDFDERVTQAKREWLTKHLPSVEWNEIHIVSYGTPKQNFSSGMDILFDDEKPNRIAWNSVESNFSFDVHNIIGVLKSLC